MSVTASPSGGPSPSANPSPSSEDAVAKEIAAAIAAGGSSGGRVEGRVYWGIVPQYGNPYAAQQKGTLNFITETQAQQDFDHWDEKKLNDFIAQGIVGGLIQPGGGEVEARRVWNNLVADAGQYGLRGNPVSPFDILAQYVNRAGGLDKGQWVDTGGGMQRNVITGEVRYVGPKFKTTTQTSTNVTDPDTARALTTSVFQSLLGRDPMPGELAQFADALHAAEQNAPATTHTTTEFDSDGNPVGSTSYTEGGLDAAGKQYLLEQRAKKNPEFGATQAATTYLNAFENAIGG